MEPITSKEHDDIQQDFVSALFLRLNNIKSGDDFLNFNKGRKIEGVYFEGLYIEKECIQDIIKEVQAQLKQG